jgi:ribosomal protein L37E
MGLIDKQRLLAEARKLNSTITGRDKPFPVAEAFMEVIEKQPTVEPRTKGEWVMVYHNSRHTTGHIECNQCGWRSGDWTKHNFCPHCGADMRGEEE